MKFYYAKKELTCVHCKTTIKRGESFVRHTLKNRFGLQFHPTCYINWTTERILSSYLKWRDSAKPVKPLGRPKKFSNPVLAQRLRCLMAYHEKVGNTDKEMEMKARLEELRL